MSIMTRLWCISNIFRGLLDTWWKMIKTSLHVTVEKWWNICTKRQKLFYCIKNLWTAIKVVWYWIGKKLIGMNFIWNSPYLSGITMLPFRGTRCRNGLTFKKHHQSLLVCNLSIVQGNCSIVKKIQCRKKRDFFFCYGSYY